MPSDRSALVPVIHNVATQLRIDSVLSTTAAGSGHPSSCASAADIVASLFFAEMRFDPHEPRHDRRSLRALEGARGADPLRGVGGGRRCSHANHLLKLRELCSDLEGHPTPRLPFVDVATGSLGQGLCAGVGIALNARRIGSGYRTYVLLGEEKRLKDLSGRRPKRRRSTRSTTCGHHRRQSARPEPPDDVAARHGGVASKWRAFGWHAIVVDGHDINALLDAYAEARTITGRPTMILARTFKGHGIPAIEDKDAWHGKPLKKGEEADAAVRRAGGAVRAGGGRRRAATACRHPQAGRAEPSPASRPDVPAPAYKLGDSVATREAYGVGAGRLGALDARIVVLDADVGNSTFSEKFEKPFPDRFYQMYIAEQVMVGAATGLAARGAIPFPSTFACFLTRAYDFIRMAAISSLNVKLAGSHAGVSIGEDGPSQMALEDIAMMRAEPNMTVLYPCEAVSAERLVELAAYHPGPAYIRTSRPKTPVIYEPTEEFHVGGSKVLRQSASDVATVVGAGVTSSRRWRPTTCCGKMESSSA